MICEASQIQDPLGTCQLAQRKPPTSFMCLPSQVTTAACHRFAGLGTPECADAQNSVVVLQTPALCSEGTALCKSGPAWLSRAFPLVP